MAIISNRNKISTAGYRSIRESEFLRDRDKLQADIQSLFADYDTLYKQDSERGGGIDVYRTDSSAWYDNVSGLDSSLQAKADDVLKRVEYYKNYIDPEYYNNLTKSIGNIKSNGSSILANAQSMKDLYSNFKDEGEYMEWLEDYKYLNQDANEVKRELDSLKSQLDNLTGGNPNNFTPEAHALAKQYEEKTAYYNQLLKDQEVYEILSNKDEYNSLYEQAQGHKNPLLYSPKAVEEGKYNRSQTVRVPYGANAYADDYFNMSQMTDDEKYVYNVMFAQDPKKAEEYYQSILPSLETRKEEAGKIGMQKVSQIPVLRGLLGLTAGVASGAEILGNAANALITGEEMERSKLTDFSSAMYKGGVEDIKAINDFALGKGIESVGKIFGQDWSDEGEKVANVSGEIGSFVYTATMSGLQSIGSAMLMGGAYVSPFIRTIPMAASAVASGYNDALDRGMSGGKAVLNGFVNGLIEWGAEAISSGMSMLFAEQGEEVIKATLGAWLKEIGVNFAEESLTEVASTVYDTLVNGEYSDYQKLIADGLTPEEAFIELAGESALAGLAGAIMGAEQMIGVSIRQNKVYKNKANVVGNMLSASGYSGDTKLTTDAILKTELGKKLSDDEQKAYTEFKAYEKGNRTRYEFNQYLDVLKVGKNGRENASQIEIGDRDAADVASAFNALYVQGLRGNDISAANSRKASILSENEQRIAYNAGKMDAIERKIAEGAKTAQESAKVEAPKTAKATTKQSSTTVFSTSSNVSSEIAKIDNAKMREYAKSFKLGVEGVKSYGSLKNDEQGVGQYTEDFVRAYNAGKNGSDISRVPHGSLTDAQRQIAYNSGKMDALKSKSEAKVNAEMRDLGQTYRFGKEGIKAYRSIIKDNQNVGKYTEDFVKAYNAGKKGVDLSRVGLGSLTDTQRRMAYNAGKADAMQKSEATFKSTDESTSTVTTKATSESKAAVKATKIFSSGEKVTVADDAKLTEEQKNIRDNFAKYGIKVYFGDIRTSTGAAGNGLYDHGTGDIYLSTDPKKALQFVAKHELTHFIEKRIGQQQYFDLMNTIFDSETFKKWYGGKGFKSLTEMTSNKIAEYRQGGMKLDDMGAKQEILADFVGEMLFGGENRISDNLFSELDDNHKKTFREWIGAVLERIKSIFAGDKNAENEITKLEAKFKEMLKESLKSEAPGETNTVSLNYSAVEEHKDMLAREFNTVESVTTLEALQEKYDKVVEIWERLGGEINSEFLKEWNAKGQDKAFTIFKSQAGYKYNIELSTMCRKGVALFDAIDQIVRKEVMQELGLKKIGKQEKEILYDILKGHNFEIPCAICYVEQARQREGTIIKDFIDGKSGKIGWNTALKDIQAEMQKLGVDYTFPQLDRSVATEAYSVSNINMDANTKKAFYAALRTVTNKAITEYNKANGKNRALATADTAESIANALKGRTPQNLLVFKTLLANPNSRFFIDGDLLYSSNTTHNIASYHHDLYSLFNQQSGVAGYKLKQTPVVYWGDVLSKNWRPDTVRKGGGIRNQSNSDGQMYQFLDMVQMYIDLTAKGQYLQAYTKTVHELKLLGLSNAKINASLIPKVVVYKNADGSVDVSKTQMNAGLDEKGNVIFDNVEGINSREALMLLADGEYSKSVAGCCIAYSDKHLMKLLDDSRIQLIIGFHDKTNDPNKRYRGAMYAKNYNGLNEAKDSEGKTVHIGFNQFMQKAEKMFKYDKKNGVFTGAIEHNGIDYIANDIPRLATQLYLEYCEEKGYTPAYSLEGLDIPHHPNYYKLLADFGLYDSNGNYAPHKKVDFNLPDTVPYLDANGNKAYMDSYKYLKKELESELAVKDAVSEALADESSNGIIPQFKAAVSESSASLSYTPDEGVDNMSERDYNNYGWVRDNDIINIGYWDNFTENFAQAVNGKHKFPKNKDGEFMISVYDKYSRNPVDDVIVFARGTIDSPIVSKIIAFTKNKPFDLETERRNIYEIERRGIQPTSGELFRRYDSIAFRSNSNGYSNSGEIRRNNNEFGVRRGDSTKKAQRIKRVKVNDDGSMTYYYSDGSTFTDSESSLSYTPAIDEQELTRMAQNGEITAEEYGRRMLEIKESRTVDDPYSIARMNKEDLENPLPDINRKNGRATGDGHSKFHDSLQRTSIFDDTFKEEVKSDQFIEQYKTITNKETLAEAAKLLDEGGQEFVNTWFNKKAIRMSPVDTAVGFILLKRYQDISKYDSAAAVAEKLREIGTKTGQNLQLFSILNRFTPEMMQVYAQKQLDAAFEEMAKSKTQNWINKNKDKFKLTDEDIDFIRTRTLQAAMLPNGSREQAIRLAEITARLQDKIPPTFSTSFKTWSRMSMLFNAKTHIRNVLGNGIIAPAFVASDWFGTPVDLLLSKFTGQRTTGLTGAMRHNKKDLADALKGAHEAYEDFLRGINTRIDFDKFKIDGAGKGFNEQKYGKMARVLNNIDSFNSFLLTAEDALFYEMWFMNSLNNQKKLNNVSEATLEMIEIAQQEALQRTWQDNNIATKVVGSIKKVLNLDFTFTNQATGKTYNPYHNRKILKILPAGYGFGDVFIKFVKTPANLTKAIYDFSPAAFISVAGKSAEFISEVKKGTVSPKLQKDLVNSVGKAIAGSLVYAIFGALYAAGKITGKGDDDKDIATFEKYVQGMPEYAIKIGKKWWSYDWAQPVGAIPAIIANAQESIADNDKGSRVIWEALSAGGDVLFDQSFMSSIQQIFSSTNFFGNLATAVLNEITVPIPTLSSQIANVFDDKRRTTYNSQSSIRTAINKVAQKIPGLRNTLEVERDILGRETPNSQKHWVNAFFNPANTYTDTSTAVTDHVYELYQSTGKASAIPAKAPYDVTIKGVKHTFSIEERNEYQRIMGETSAQIIGELINNDSYIALTDEQKLEVIKSVYTYAQGLAKSELGLAESYDVISEIKVDLTQDQYNAMSGEEIKAIADDYLLSSYYSLGGLDTTKKATWFVNKSLPTAVNAAIKAGDMAKAKKLINSIEANIKSLGLPAKETKEMIKKSQASIKSEITSYWKGKFIEAHKRGDNGEKIRIKQILVDTGLYGNSADVRDLTNGWKKEK